MKKIIVVLANIVLISSFLISCGDQLDVPPHSAISGQNVTEKDVPALENGMYRYCQNMRRESFILNDLLGGFVMLYTHSTVIASINSYTQVDNGTVENIWNSYFTTLAKVNNVITSTNALSETDANLKAKGAAYFMRAYIYLNLVTHWGDVPILEEPATNPLRNPAGEVWKFIEDDLDRAIDCLKPYNETGIGYYYVTQDAAIALKARVLLYLNRKSEAAALAESLITGGVFTLDSFDNIFRAATNSETIFAFLNQTDESSTNLSSLFYNYDHPNSGSYFQRPDNSIMFLFDDDDLRKAISWENIYGGVNYFNKYPSGQVGTDPVIVVRIAEMYLISAEAKGRTGGGLERLNELRRFRGLTDVNPTTDDEFIEAILHERDLEFLTENHRFYDLVRTGKTSKIGIQEYQKLLPIPEEQRRLAPNLGQNDGY